MLVLVLCNFRIPSLILLLVIGNMCVNRKWHVIAIEAAIAENTKEIT